MSNLVWNKAHEMPNRNERGDKSVWVLIWWEGSHPHCEEGFTDFAGNWFNSDNEKIKGNVKSWSYFNRYDG